MSGKLTPKFEVLVDGARVPSDVVERIISIVVRLDLKLADTIELRLSNDDLRFTEGDTFAEGKKLTVKLGYCEGDLTQVATGKIVRRECEFPQRGPSIVTVIAYDARFTLKNGVHTKTWKDVKDSDVAQQIIAAAGLTADVQATDGTHKYVFQNAQTDLAFLADRAAANGYAVTVDRDNQKVSFRKPDPSAAAAVKLTWGQNLLGFRPRFSTHGQVSNVSVRGWDMTQKKAVTAEASLDDLDSAMGLSVTGGSRAKDRYGERAVLTPGAFSTQDEAKAFAKAIINQSLREFAQGQGTVQGEPLVTAGCVVEIEGTGKRASGKYFVTSVFHHYDPRGFLTIFDFIRPGESPVTAPPPKQQGVPPRKDEPAEEPPTFVEVEVAPESPDVDVVGTHYRLTLPDGRVLSGQIGADRTIRVEGIRMRGDVKIELQSKDGHYVPLES